MAVAEETVELTKQQMMKTQKLFGCYDANEDGKISVSEVHAQLTANYESEEAEKEAISGFLKRFDENGDDVVTLDEMKNYVVGIKTRLAKHNKEAQLDVILDKMIKEQIGKVTAEERELVDKYFDMFDKNEDGCIKIDEMKDQLNDEDMRLNAFLKRFDENKDGMVSHDEVMLYCVNMKVRIAGNKKVSLTKILTNMIDAQMPKLDTLELHKTKQLFACYDANEDGQIDFAELQKQLAASASSEASAEKAMKGFLKRFDENKDGVVTLDEMNNYVLAMKTRLANKGKEAMVKTILDKMINEQVGKVSAEERELVDKYFGLFDANEDGSISLDEVKDQLNDENMKLKAFLKRFDANDDNKVSKTEVLLYCVNTKVRIANNPNVDLSKILNNMIASQSKKEEVAEN